MVFELSIWLAIVSRIFVITHASDLQLLHTPQTSASSVPSNRSTLKINSNRLVPQDFDVSRCLQKSKSLLCNEASNYPWKEVQNILSSRKLPLEFFGNDSSSISDMDSGKHAGSDDPTEYDARHRERGLCDSKEELRFPKIALNTNLELRYIIQGDASSVRRGIVTESCVPNGQCMFAQNLPPEISVRCGEKYLNKKLLALNPTTRDAYIDEFPIPSCCVCMYEEKDDG